MNRSTLRTLVVLTAIGAATGLAGCTVYDAGPAYPYGYYYGPGYDAPGYYSGPNLYLGYGRGGGWHHRHWRHWRGWR